MRFYISKYNTIFMAAFFLLIVQSYVFAKQKPIHDQGFSLRTCTCNEARCYTRRHIFFSKIIYNKAKKYKNASNSSLNCINSPDAPPIIVVSIDEIGNNTLRFYVRFLHEKQYKVGKCIHLSKNDENGELIFSFAADMGSIRSIIACYDELLSRFGEK